MRSWNTREFAFRTSFDALRRPTHVYSKQGTNTETLVQRTLYGESLGSTASKAANLRGHLFRSYDSAGVHTEVSRDFKGNLLETERVLALDYTTTPDWIGLASLTDVQDIENEAASLLETETFTTSTTYDALNRVVTSTSPDASVTRPSYNEANQLVAVEADLRGGPPRELVESIEYNARGQRVKVTYTNNTFTEYEYDAKTFRLTKLKTTRTSDSATVQDLRYFYDAVGNVMEVRDLATQSLFLTDTSAPALVSGDALYEYDPLYRLVSAEGREHPAHSGTQVDAVDSPVATLPHPNDTQALRRYTEDYEYDGVGNILEVAHTAGVDGWTRWYQYATTSNRLTGTSDTGDVQDVPYANTTSYTDSYTHDARGNMTSMPHLAAMDWDHGDRLQHCDLGGGGDSYFVYDAAGQRVRKVWEKSAT